MSLGNNRWRGKTSILIVQRFAKRRKCRKVPYSREETVPRFRKIEIYRFVIHDSRREKDILFFPARLQKRLPPKSIGSRSWNTGTVARE